MVLSHWHHVAEQVQQQLQQLVAELVEQHVASAKAPLRAHYCDPHYFHRLPLPVQHPLYTGIKLPISAVFTKSYVYSPPGEGAMSMSVCLSVCPISAYR